MGLISRALTGAAVLGLAAAAMLGAGAADAATQVPRGPSTGALHLLSASPSGEPANSPPYSGITSPDGTWLAFTSKATNLTTDAGVDGSSTHVFAVNRLTGRTVLLETRADGSMASIENGAWQAIAFSPDSSLVLLRGNAQGAPGTPFIQRLWVKNLRTGVLTVVSADAAGTPGTEQSYTSKTPFSSDSRSVVFGSSGLTAAPGNAIYVKNVDTGAVTRVSAPLVEGASMEISQQSGVMSPDGSRVAYTDFSDGLFHVYVVNAADGAVIAIAALNAGGPSVVSFSPDSSKLYYTGATTPVINTQVYALDILNNASMVVSTSASDVPADASVVSGKVLLSPDGRKLAFASAATNLVEGANPAWNDTGTFQQGALFVKDLVTGDVMNASSRGLGKPLTRFGKNTTILQMSFSPNSGWVTFFTDSTNFAGKTLTTYAKQLTDSRLIVTGTDATGAVVGSSNGSFLVNSKVLLMTGGQAYVKDLY